MFTGFTTLICNFVFNTCVLTVLKFQVWIIYIVLILWAIIKLSYNKLFKVHRFLYQLLLLIIYVINTCFYIFINLLYFYITFEIRLIIIIVILLGWGYQFEKIQASYYILMYTIVFRIPFLLSIVVFITTWKLNRFYTGFIGSLSFIISVSVLIVFIRKLPLYFVHLWLPKAHVESMVTGSIILAAILLKIGRYGLFIQTIFLKFILSFTSTILLWLIIISLLVCNFVLLNQSDQKKLIAYYSVSHISLSALVLIIYSKISYTGFVFIRISHAIASNILFYFCGLFYRAFNTRIIIIIQGLIICNLLLNSIIIVIILTNIGVPLIFSFVAELILYKGLIIYNLLIIIVLLRGIFTICYSVFFLYNVLALGKIKIVINTPIIIDKEIMYMFVLMYWNYLLYIVINF